MQTKILRAMDKKGIKASQLSRATKIHQTSISRFFADDQRLYWDQIKAIADALDLSLDYLADDALDEPPSSPQLSPDEEACLRAIRVLGAQKALERLLRPELILLPPDRA